MLIVGSDEGAALVGTALDRGPLARILLQPASLGLERGLVGPVDIELVGIEIDCVLPHHLGEEIGLAARRGRRTITLG